MREQHRKSVEKLVRGDRLSLEHSCDFLLTAEEQLMAARILVQIVPSIAEGLRYAVFLKALMPQRRLFVVRNG